MIYALGIILAGLSVLWILLPLLTGKEASLTPEDAEMGEAQHRRRMALLALRDVEYDYLAGKLDEEDYRTLKLQISAEALDALDAASGARSGPADLEAEIEAMRQHLRDGLVCATCAHLNPRGARFCAGCGAALPKQAAEVG
jgi:hypothetical protein